ncbi:MAG: hypothetical protein P8P56_10150 [Yoonia sp.]|nr:hypothetical protein [Yoonia sp.]MDG1863791.1 hypothetical protein [Yoonia sp.]
MTLAPYLTAAPNIQLHIVLALILGPMAINQRRRDRTRQVVGYVVFHDPQFCDDRSI